MILTERERRELSDLASAAADGRLSDADAMRLEQILCTSEAARLFYVRFMDVSAGMAWAARAQPEPALAGRLDLHRTHAHGWKVATAAVAVLAVAAITAFSFLQTRKMPPPLTPAAGIATLSTAMNVEWANNEEPDHVGNLLKPGWVRIKSGLAQIDFINGASVWLEGPVDFRLDSAHEAFCESGKLVAQVPGGASEFRIATPYMSAVENATGFGLEVNRGTRASIHVFRGTLNVTVMNGRSTRNVGAGQAVTVDQAGQTLVMQADPGTFSRQEFAPPWTGQGFGTWGRGSVWSGWHPGGPWNGSPPDFFHAPFMGAAVPPAVMLPGQWKGADPMAPVHDLLGVGDDRWAEIRGPLEAFLTEQWKSWGMDNNPVEKGVSRAKWDLRFAVENPDSTDSELSRRTQALREARSASRKALEEKELKLLEILTIQEQTKLVNWGYIP